ncbi:DUF4173 domain-containing protein [Actinoplanes sp. NPDC049596]|uniref:DUF4153 domain-containing protein n=1 Tax=unclassified Actinoplanes TaxID=2626549 RepID=UPI003416B673
MHGPWPADGPWGRQWSGPAAPPRGLALLAVLATAAVSAAVFPDHIGFGWLIIALTSAAALMVTQKARPAPTGPTPLVVRPQHRPGKARLAWAFATVALIAVGTVRSAGWLFALCLATATITLALTLAGGRSLRGIYAAYTMPLIASFRAVPWLARGLARLHRPGAGAGVRIAATAAVSIVLLAAFGGLLASADLYFSQALASVIPDLSGGSFIRWVFIFTVTVMIVGGAAFLVASPPHLSKLDETEGRKVHRWEWAVPLGLLTMLFGAFVGVQAVVLLHGNYVVAEYANAARTGFFQLSAVTGLTLVVLAGAARWAPRDRPADRVLIRVILGALTTLTMVIAATALHRMNIYTAEYGLTRLRLLVFCCELWIMFALGLVLLAGVRIRAPWLPRVAIAAGVLALLGLAAANPDAMIAERNLHPAPHREIDLVYLQNLSPDAVPVIARMPGDRRDCVLSHIEIATGDWRSWNWGREHARQLIGANTRCGS